MAENESVVGPAEVAIRGQIKRTDSGALKAPDNIINSLSAARALYVKFRGEHLKRVALYAAIEGLVSGNPPYNPADLAAAGLGHIANFNTLEGRSVVERSCLAYFNLTNESRFIAKFTILDDSREARSAEDIISIEFDRIVRKWPAFYTQMNTLAEQLVKFGVSPVLWPDERDWRWRTIELSKFYIADQAQCDMDKITALCVESYFTAQELWGAYEETVKKKDTSKWPWDAKALEELLFAVANTFAKQTYNIVDFFDMQKRLQNGDLSYDVIFTDSIPLVSLFYREYDGKWSHYMFHRTVGVTGFPYSVDRQYDSLDEALVIFTASPGEYTIHSNRGVGHRAFSMCQAIMMNDCSTVDGSRWASSPILKGTGISSTDVSQIRFTPGSPINIGSAELQQNQMGANLQQQVYVSQYLRQVMNANIANSGDDPGIPDRNKGSLSAPEVAKTSFKEFGVLKNNVCWYYNFLDTLYQTMVKKMLRAKPGWPMYEWTRYFINRCIAQGVPEEIFSMKNLSPWGMPEKLEVAASRVAGDGSILGRLMGLERISPIAGDFGPKEAREYKRQLVSAALGKEQVGAFLPDENDTDSGAGGSTIANLENNDMRQGNAALMSLDNDHKAHFATHMALATDTIQAIKQQQMDVVQADKIFSVLVPHLQEHFGAAARSPFARVWTEKHKRGLDQIVQYATLNRKNAEKEIEAQIRRQQEQAQQTQQVMSDEQIKNMKAQGDERRADYKVNSQVERAKEASDTRAEVQRKSAQAAAENKRLEIQLKHSNDVVKTNNENAVDSLEASREKLSTMIGEGGPGPADLPVSKPIPEKSSNIY